MAPAQSNSLFPFLHLNGAMDPPSLYTLLFELVLHPIPRVSFITRWSPPPIYIFVVCMITILRPQIERRVAHNTRKAVLSFSPATHRPPPQISLREPLKEGLHG